MGEERARRLRVIVTGASGMLGEGVLHECLVHDLVEKVLVVGRRPCGWTHPKLEEIIHRDFHDLAPVESRLGGYDACFFCLGVSSVGMSEKDYRDVSYTLTMHAAGMLARLNPSMTFCYISGAGTDSSEKGRVMWARVKGETENALMKLPFARAFAFRPAMMIPTKGMKHTLRAYRIIAPLLPFARAIAPGFVTTLGQVGRAMINAALYGYGRNVIEVKDIVELAGMNSTAAGK